MPRAGKALSNMRDAMVDAGRGWVRHHDARLGAALAYYSVFSLGPLLLIVVSVAGLLFGDEAVRTSLTGEFRTLLGPVGSQAVEAMLKGAGSPSGGRLAAITGVVLLLAAALAVVVQLKDALNTIWDTKEPESAGLWWYVRTYLVSFAGILALGFLLAVSLVASTTLTALSSWLGGGATTLLWEMVNFALSMAALTVLFALLFKWFPDAEVAWQDAWRGGAVTALLFNIGKLAIAWYIGTQALESTYGAAASVVVLLVWVYYSAQIVLYGAEFTHALSARSAASPSSTTSLPRAAATGRSPRY
jgi:membrane protein